MTKSSSSSSEQHEQTTKTCGSGSYCSMHCPSTIKQITQTNTTRTFISDFFTSRTPSSLPLYPSGTRSSQPTNSRKIQVLDFYLNPATITYKGKSVKVFDLELFHMLIADWRKRYGWSKKQAYDEFFSCIGFDL